MMSTICRARVMTRWKSAWRRERECTDLPASPPLRGTLRSRDPRSGIFGGRDDNCSLNCVQTSVSEGSPSRARRAARLSLQGREQLNVGTIERGGGGRNAESEILRRVDGGNRDIAKRFRVYRGTSARRKGEALSAPMMLQRARSRVEYVHVSSLRRCFPFALAHKTGRTRTRRGRSRFCRTLGRTRCNAPLPRRDGTQSHRRQK